jgi:hypothetical protein
MTLREAASRLGDAPLVELAHLFRFEAGCFLHRRSKYYLVTLNGRPCTTMLDLKQCRLHLQSASGGKRDSLAGCKRVLRVWRPSCRSPKPHPEHDKSSSRFYTKLFIKRRSAAAKILQACSEIRGAITLRHHLLRLQVIRQRALD